MKERVNRVKLRASSELHGVRIKMMTMDGRKGEYSNIPTRGDWGNPGRIK